MLWHVFQNGWEDKDFIAKRVYGMDDVRKEVAKWTPDEVERVTGVPGEQLQARRREVREGEAGDASSGAWARRSTRSAPPTCAPSASPALRPAMSARPAPAPTSSAATPTCRARPTSASISPPCRSTTASPKPPGSTGRASGRSSTSGCRASSTRCRRRPAARPAPARRTWRRPASPRRGGSTP